MDIVVNADTVQQQALLARGIPGAVTIHWLDGTGDIPDADAYFDLLYEETGIPVFVPVTGKPVFISSVIETCATLPAGNIRINAWNGFLQQPKIELATAAETLDASAVNVLEALNWSYIQAPDTPGMIAARVIAMIINEAYYGLGDDISTKAAMDTAMKLGTNYPYGPFEWAERIGLQKICALLKKLSHQNTRYTIAPLLEKEAQSTNRPINQ